MNPTRQPRCAHRHNTFNGWSGQYPTCALPPDHRGHHQTSYGLTFDNNGNTVVVTP